MELIGNHLQVFVSVVLILVAIFVALVCDLLKRNNEHLREVNVELRIRNAEEVRRNQMLMEATRGALVAPVESNITAEAAQPAIDRADEMTSRHGVRRAAAPAAEVPAGIQPGASLAEARMLAREFMGRAAARARGEEVDDHSGSVAREPEVMVEQPAACAASPAASLPRKDWSRILNSTRRQSAPVEVVPQPAGAQKSRLAELIPFESIQNQSPELSIPEGFHEGMMLARILNGEKTVRGLVVVIGINDLAARRENAGELGAEALLAGFTDHLRSLLRAGDFACQSSQDEFLMICPNERAAAAQQRLGEIAESLWDYQLRSVGTSPILFSWGAVEAKDELFAGVLATASERMQETRRSRRSLAIEAPLRRKAV